MAVIRPFRALRPGPDAVASVAAVPYDVVSTAEARVLATGNPLSFLHVSRPEIDLPLGTNPYADEVYTAAAQNLRRLVDSAPMVQEAQSSLYFYRLHAGEHEQVGLVACYSLDEYDRGLIKKHEGTVREKEDDRTRHMLALGAQTGITFLLYRASAEVNALAHQAMATDPLFDFEAADAVRHTIWHVPAADLNAVVSAFVRVPALYIADGHHRIASAARTRDKLSSYGSRAPSGEAEYKRFLGVAFPDDQAQILPCHRTVEDLAGLSPQKFLGAVTARFRVREGPVAVPRKREAGMYLPGRWYSLDLTSAARVGSSPRRISELDVSVLHDELLEPVLKIADMRTDNRIAFVGGGRGVKELERVVDTGGAAVAFALSPVTVEELIAVADAGETMPPKSTWFEPKLRDGLLIHTI